MRHLTMKDIPHDDRPYELRLREGPEYLSDAELLSIIIRTGSKEDTSLDLASKILALNYPKEGILGLLHLTLPELMSVKGIGKVKGIQLLCIGELSRRIWKRKAVEQMVAFHEPKEIAAYYQEDMRHREQEQFRVMLFNTKQVLLRDILISKGTVNASLATPREIFIAGAPLPGGQPDSGPQPPSGDPEQAKRTGSSPDGSGRRESSSASGFWTISS